MAGGMTVHWCRQGGTNSTEPSRRGSYGGGGTPQRTTRGSYREEGRRVEGRREADQAARVPHVVVGTIGSAASTVRGVREGRGRVIPAYRRHGNGPRSLHTARCLGSLAPPPWLRAARQSEDGGVGEECHPVSGAASDAAASRCPRGAGGGGRKGGGRGGGERGRGGGRGEGGGGGGEGGRGAGVEAARPRGGERAVADPASGARGRVLLRRPRELG